MTGAQRRKGWKNFVSYGSGDYALNLFWQGAGYYLFFFYTTVLGVPATVAGTILLIGSVWDGLSDPVMGLIADRTRSRWGPDKPYILFGAVPLSLSFILLFTPITVADSLPDYALLLGILLVFRTAYTVVSIPYSTLGARTTRNSDARTRLAGVRMYFGFLGGVSISLLAKALQEHMDGSAAFELMATVAGVAAVVVLLACFTFTRESRNPINETSARVSARTSLASAFRNRPFLLLVGAILLVSVANTVITHTTLFFFDSRFGTSTSGHNAIIIMTAAPLLTIPLWSALALRLGKRQAWILGSLTAAAGFMLLGFDDSANVTLAYLEIGIVTVGVTSYAVIFWSMLPDTIEYGTHTNAVHTESFLFGIASSIQKIAIGFTALALGFLIDLVGFEPGKAASIAAADGVRNIYTLIPTVAILGSAVLISFYPITAELHAEIVAKLKRRTN